MKIIHHITVALLIIFSLTTGCKKDDSYEDQLKPWKAPKVQMIGDPLIGAYYNLSFTDSTWLNIDPLYIPELGKYNSTDAGVLEQHIAWSAESGIDFWIIGQNQTNDSLIINQFPTLNGIENISVALEFSLSTLSHSSSFKLTDSASIANIVSEFKGMKEVFDQSFYLKVDGKPVVVLQSAYNYQPQPKYASGDLVDERVEALADLRSLLKDSTGYDFFFIGNYIGWFPPDRFPEYITSFDALTNSMFTDRKSLSIFLNESIFLSLDNWKNYLQSRSVPMIPAVFPGRNDTITSQNDILPRSEEFFTDQCKIAKSCIDNNLRMVIINSFNNWHSGTQTEPANNYGQSYLDVIKNEFTVN